MSQDTWSAVDQYFVDRLVPQDSELLEALAASEAAGLPAINVAPNQGKLLYLFAKLVQAKRILEIGTLGGYSTIWMAKALPADGRLVTLEFDPHHAEVAKENLKRAGFEGLAEVRVGAALESLPLVESDGLGPFDLVFIDADKQNNPSYFRWALKLSRPGSLILIDNVVRGGAVLDMSSEDPNVRGVQEVLELVGSDSRVTATAIQTVGSKGWDGLAVVFVN
jgi:predicted O-methyltransferase YrrM